MEKKQLMVKKYGFLLREEFLINKHLKLLKEGLIVLVWIKKIECGNMEKKQLMVKKYGFLLVRVE